MRLQNFEQGLTKKIEQALPGAAPGVIVQVHQGGRKVCDVSVGQTYPYYDLASLTKIIFTVQTMMKAFDEGKWNLQSKLSDFLPWYPHTQLRIVECLSHCTGLPWWMPFYKQLDIESSRLEKWNQLSRIIREIPLEPVDVSVYSDPDFLLLGMCLEAMYSKPLDEVWKESKNIFYSGSTLHFNIDNQPKFERKFYAPTEKCPWRGRVLQAEVHDENCWALGGVSTHAGLFGSIDDVTWFGLLLRSQIQGISKTHIKSKTARLFATRARPEGKGDWALGYMMPTPGASSAGVYFSTFSVGHTGFTGTSIWYDPTIDLLIVILSNRVNFGRENKNFVALRPQIHNWIIEGLKRA